jgi:chlorobactene glucosyltransferase
MRALSQRGLLPRLQANPAHLAPVPAVAVIVPVRNEAANIGRCLTSLLAQDYPAEKLKVVVVDDHSADATAAIVRRVGANDPRLTLLTSPALPARWTGKSHACWIGARSVATDYEWLCFIDADVWGRPELVSSAIDAATARRLDLLSLAPRQELQSFAERLMLPCGLIALSLVQNLRQVQEASCADVTVSGQFMLIRRDAYEALSGHAAVSNAICEDLEFARRLKQSGRAVLLMDGDEMVSTRMYSGWQTLWPGIAKNLVDTFGGPLMTLAVVWTAFALSWAAVLLPLFDAFGCAAGSLPACTALILAVLGSAAAFGLHIAATFYFRIPFWYGLLFPLGYTAGALLAVDSVRRRRTGQVSWKGRIYS